MKNLSKSLKKMLDALAHAHAGEYLSQRQKHRFLSRDGQLNNVVAESTVPAPKKSRRHARCVALYLGNELPAEVMDYVIQTCARLQHELTVVTFQTESTGRALLQPYQEALVNAGVNMELVVLSGEPVAGLRRYLRGRPEIAFMACKDSGYLGRSFLAGTQRKNALPVPVVVVNTNEQGGESVQPALEQNGKKAVVA